MTQYIADEAHFKEVLSRVPLVKRSLWIGTADIKDLYVGDRPFLGLLSDLISKGREVRLIHAKEPGPNFREDFDRYPVLFTGLERVLCPRVHFKILVFDSKVAYFGSANLTGAGIGSTVLDTEIGSKKVSLPVQVVAKAQSETIGEMIDDYDPALIAEEYLVVLEDDECFMAGE